MTSSSQGNTSLLHSSNNSTGQISSTSAKSKQIHQASASGAALNNQHQPNYPCSSTTIFQQVKQTQASLARLTRVQQLNNSNNNGQTNQSNQQLKQPNQSSPQSAQAQQATTRSTTFVDCLIRRFKDCFNEDCCTVPMFVVGNLSPGSDGTHLILPPCVSLGGQNISRFASPKNMRLMNSIRESCRSIEELDLGGNKLNDLIEVYKILQCTPNLRFLNLSENDLSRSSPVAMAATCLGSTQNSPPLGITSSSLVTSNVTTNSTMNHQWSSSSVAFNSNRTCLAPINQNQHSNTSQHQQAIRTRRHSSLGQSESSVSSIGQRARVGEARRLAATAAVAQSKKTSSSVASKLASSVGATGVVSLTRQGTGTSRRVNTLEDQDHKSTRILASQRHQASSSSTMHLARSLSSLSAKDVRAASSSLGRLSTHRPSTRRTGGLRSSADTQQSQAQSKTGVTNKVAHLNNEQQQQLLPIGSTKQQMVPTSSSKQQHQTKPTQTSHPKLFVEPIEESDDVDMGEQQNHPDSTAESGTGSDNHEVNSQRVATTTTTVAISSAHSNQSRALALNSSNNLTSATKSHPGTSSGQSSANYRRTFESIKALALNNTGCQWRVVCSILSRMPNLEELHLSLNNYGRIDLDPNEFRHPSLKRLYLCNNPKLTNWEELDKLLIAFPSLEALSIADCNISQIPDNLDRAREWRKLCGLNINGWPIKEWPVIERLNQLPSLIDLKCRNLEILSTIDEPRHHLIARLPKLQRLNGSEIEEREHAEKAFIRFFMANSHLERPPRFHELIQVHGEVMGPVDVDVDLSPPSHASVRVIFLNKNYYRKENTEDIFMSEDFLTKLMDNVEPVTSTVHANNEITSSNHENMEVAITCNEPEEKPTCLFKDDSQEVVAIDVDLRQSVRKFKSTLASLFGLASQNVILYYIDSEMVGLMGPELIKHNQKKLWNYNVQDGDQFIVEER